MQKRWDQVALGRFLHMHKHRWPVLVICIQMQLPETRALYQTCIYCASEIFSYMHAYPQILGPICGIVLSFTKGQTHIILKFIQTLSASAVHDPGSYCYMDPLSCLRASCMAYITYA